MGTQEHTHTNKLHRHRASIRIPSKRAGTNRETAPASSIRPPSLKEPSSIRVASIFPLNCFVLSAKPPSELHTLFHPSGELSSIASGKRARRLFSASYRHRYQTSRAPTRLEQAK